MKFKNKQPLKGYIKFSSVEVGSLFVYQDTYFIKLSNNLVLDSAFNLNHSCKDSFTGGTTVQVLKDVEITYNL